MLCERLAFVSLDSEVLHLLLRGHGPNQSTGLAVTRWVGGSQEGD